MEKISRYNILLYSIVLRRAIITENVAQAVDLREADDYFSVMVRLSDELRKMQEVLLVLIK